MLQSVLDAEKCMSLQDNNAQMSPCTAGGGQLWSEADGVFTAQRNPDECLHWDTTSGNVEAAWCHQARNERFVWDGARLRSREDAEMCLEWDDAFELKLFHQEGWVNL